MIVQFCNFGKESDLFWCGRSMQVCPYDFMAYCSEMKLYLKF